jgi:hypothetical protein
MADFIPGKKEQHRGGIIRTTTAGTYVAEVNRDGKTGKRQRKTFKNKTAARTWIESTGAMRDKGGDIVSKITPRRIEDAADALAILRNAGLSKVSLRQSAAEYADRHKKDATAWTVRQVYDAHMKLLKTPIEGDPARPRTIRDKVSRLRSFLELHGDTPVTWISKQDVEAWLDSTGAKPRNLRNHKTAIQSLFNAAEKEIPELAYTNTVAKFPRRGAKEVKPAEVHTPEQARKVMAYLNEHHPKAVVAWAIGYFAGVRKTELITKEGDGISWQDIDFSARKINVPARLAKTRKQRQVRITDNLLVWLLKYRQDGGRISCTEGGHTYAAERLRTVAKVNLPNNVARHSFATYYGYLNGWRDAADELGHRGGVGMLEDHYKGVCANEDTARAYFDIEPAPAKATNVIELKGATA